MIYFALSLGILLSGTTLLLVWQLHRHSRELDSEYSVLRGLLAESDRKSSEQSQRLLTELQSLQRVTLKSTEPHPLTGVAFLPTEAGAAEIERMILATEDRAISAGPTLSSSGPTRRSGNPSGTVRSIRGVRTSGAR